MGARSALVEMDKMEIVEAVLADVMERIGEPFRLGGLGTLVAVSQGQAGKYHLDKNDDKKGYMVVVPVSTKGWGDELGDRTAVLEIPQLGVRVPVLPGQVIAFQAWQLVHRSRVMAPDQIKNRLGLTIFGCQFLSRRAVKDYEEDYGKKVKMAEKQKRE